MRKPLQPLIDVDLEALVAEALHDWTPPKWDDPVEAQRSADELNQELGITDPEDQWTADGMIEAWRYYAPENDDEARQRLAVHILSELRYVLEQPSPGSWRRKRWVSRVASFLYVSGITRSGGGSSHGPHGTTYHLPRWSDILPKFGEGRGIYNMRPYFLWKPRWWWACWIVQTHPQQLRYNWRTFHWPGPYARHVDSCGKCIPWPCCGVPTDDHAPDCVEAFA